MREIKFRVYNKLTNRLIYLNNSGYELETLYFTNHSYNDTGYCSQGLNFSEDDIIMQYTGLKDKNEKEIYEGDIVNGCMFNGSIRYGIISQCNNGWCIVPIGKFTEGVDEITKKNIEVIGNIYENLELLK